MNSSTTQLERATNLPGSCEVASSLLYHYLINPPFALSYLSHAHKQRSFSFTKTSKWSVEMRNILNLHGSSGHNGLKARRFTFKKWVSSIYLTRQLFFLLCLIFCFVFSCKSQWSSTQGYGEHVQKSCEFPPRVSLTTHSARINHIIKQESELITGLVKWNCFCIATSFDWLVLLFGTFLLYVVLNLVPYQQSMVLSWV